MDTLKKEKIEKGVTVAMLVTLLCVGIFVFFVTLVYDSFTIDQPPLYIHYNPIDTIICKGDSIIIIDVPQSKK